MGAGTEALGAGAAAGLGAGASVTSEVSPGTELDRVRCARVFGRRPDDIDAAANAANASSSSSGSGSFTAAVDIDALEAHYLAGGRVDRVVGALISADKATIDLAFNQAAFHALFFTDYYLGREDDVDAFTSLLLADREDE